MGLQPAHDRVTITEAGKFAGDFSGGESYWFGQVRAGTKTHDRITEYFKQRASEPLR